MHKSKTHKCHTNLLAVVAGLVIIIALSLPVEVSAGETAASWAQRGSIEIQGGYFMGRREPFRDIYGEGVSFGAWYRRNVANRISFGIKLNRVQLSEKHGEVYLSPSEVDTNKVTHRDFAASATLTYELYRSNALRVFGGAGLGFSFRKVTLDSPVEATADDPDASLDMSISETSPYGLLILGGDILLTRSIFFGIRASLDRHFFGDPQMGEFGDTGGFNFGGGIGIGF